MPVVIVEKKASLDPGVKAKLAAEITGVLNDVIKSPDDLISVVFHDAPADSTFRAGVPTDEALIFVHIRVGRSDEAVLRLLKACLGGSIKLVQHVKVVDQRLIRGPEVGPELPVSHTDTKQEPAGVGRLEPMVSVGDGSCWDVPDIHDSGGHGEGLGRREHPVPRRALAALGPKVLKLAAERSAGAYPFLVTPAYTAYARQLLGPDALLAVEHKVALGDPTRTRADGREAIQVHLGLANYRANLARMGFGEDDLTDGGSDALVEALVAQGDSVTAAKQLRTQLDAGASHLVVHAVPSADRLPILTALAPELGIAAREGLSPRNVTIWRGGAAICSISSTASSSSRPPSWVSDRQVVEDRAWPMAARSRRGWRGRATRGRKGGRPSVGWGGGGRRGAEARGGRPGHRGRRRY